MSEWPENATVLDSFTCNASNITGEDSNETSYDLKQTHVAAIVIYVVFVLVVIVSSLIANGLVLLLVVYDKRLRYRSFLASLNVVVADMLLILFYHVMVSANLVSRGWAFGNSGSTAYYSCFVVGVISYYVINVRWVAVGAIALDKYLTVRFPFRYWNPKQSKTLLVLMTIAVWVSPAVLFLPSTALTEPRFRANVPMCIPSCRDIFPCGLIVTLEISLSFIWGAILPSVFYTLMYCRGRKLKLKSTVTHLGRLTVQLSTGAIIEQPIMSQNNQNRERRALLTLFLMYLSVLMTSLPTYAMVLTRRVDRCIFFSIPIYIQFVFAGIFLLSTLLDPIVLMRNQDFRQALRKLFKCKSKTVVNPVPHASSFSTETRMTVESGGHTNIGNGYIRSTAEKETESQSIM